MAEGSKVVVDGNQIKGIHVENVADVLNQASEDRKDPNNGFTKNRMFRHIARLPNMAYFEARKRYPEIDTGDRFQKQKAWRKISKDPQFAPYFTVAKGL